VRAAGIRLLMLLIPVQDHRTKPRR
jgi:hypothetical protein